MFILTNEIPLGLFHRLGQFALLALLLDFSLFALLSLSPANPLACQGSSFFAATVLSFGLAAQREFSILATKNATSLGRLFWPILPVFLLVLSLRSGLFLLVTEHWYWLPYSAIIVAALFGNALLFLGSALVVFLTIQMRDYGTTSWQTIAVVSIVYVLLFKLVFMGLINAIPEEAYYWNYAQHLDIGYLDHPPMVAWLIRLSTAVLGHSEFAIRLPAFLAWIIAAAFMFRLTANLYDRSAGFRTALLLGVLPIYFGSGFFTTPDPPLYAAWAGCLYFLERVLLARKQRAWLGVGVCLGLGMLAKYTIALLGLAILSFILLDRPSRRWLLRPQPYLATIIATVFFSPVFLWNMRHNWASFAFQGPTRWAGNTDFSLHYFVFSVLLVLTPVGLLAVSKLMLANQFTGSTNSNDSAPRQRQRLWWLNFTLVPLSVFVIHSLHNDLKLHWTGPAFLAAIPSLAADMVPSAGEVSGPWTIWLRRAWLPTIIALLLVYGGAFIYFSLGLPGSPMSSARAFGSWRLLAQRVDQIEKALTNKTGSKPITVGMDKYRISSETSFYDLTDGDGPRNTGGPHFFGGRSLMWEYWLPRSAAIGRNCLMIDFERKRLMDPSLAKYFTKTGDVYSEVLEKNGRVVGSFYWRVGYGYRKP